MWLVEGYDMSYPDFLRKLCTDMLNRHGSEAENLRVKSTTIKELCLDEDDHLIDVPAAGRL